MNIMNNVAIVNGYRSMFITSALIKLFQGKNKILEIEF